MELQTREGKALMSKTEDVERNIEVIAVIVEAMRGKTIDEANIMTLLTQGMDAFDNNSNMTQHETFGAIDTLKSVADTIKRAKGAKLID